MRPYQVWLIQDLIEKNKRVFKIPVYQRNYDWGDVQCIKLFEDIMAAFHNDRKHFTGSIVYIKGEHNYSGLDEVMLIDGQQRITTIFILLKAIYEKAIDLNETRIVDELKDYLFNRNCAEEYKLKLKPVKEDDKQFQALMQNDFEKLSADSNIYKNYKLFIKLINSELSAGLLLRDIMEGLKRLEAIEIVLDKSQGDDPQTIFESINSTGLDLSLADLVRNYVLMSDENQETLYEKYWLRLEQTLSTENLADFIITFLNFKMSESVTQNNAYIKFKQLYTDKKYTNETMLSDLLHYSKYQALFIGKSNKYSQRINEYMLDFRLLDQSTIYIFLYSIFDDFENHVLDENALCDILEFFRAYCIRRIICEVPSNSLRGLFKTLYRRLFSEDTEHMYEKIYSFFVGLRSKDKIPEDLEFKQKLISGNLYNKKKVCKYLLASIENKNSKEVIDIQDLTIEHVLPQKENASSWVKALGEKYKEIYNTFLHTLGNLTITGYNGELGTRSFDEKKEIIRTYSKANRLNSDILNQSKWDDVSIKNRARNLAERIMEMFRYKVPAVVFKGLSNDEKLTFDDMDIAVGKKPVSVSVCGEIREVSSFAEMLTTCVLLLSDLDIKIMARLANTNFKIKYADRTYITNDENLLRRPKEIGNTGIYYETNLSAKNILQFIKELLDRYGLDREDFYFTIEKEK